MDPAERERAFELLKQFKSFSEPNEAYRQHIKKMLLAYVPMCERINKGGRNEDDGNLAIQISMKLMLRIPESRRLSAAIDNGHAEKECEKMADEIFNKWYPELVGIVRTPTLTHG
jgi:hypothetical protein